MSGGVPIEIILGLLMILSFLTLIVSVVGLTAYGINTLFKRMKWPNVSFTYPVFKILTSLIVASFIILISSSLTADELGILSADDDTLAEEEAEQAAADAEAQAQKEAEQKEKEEAERKKKEEAAQKEKDEAKRKAEEKEAKKKKEAEKAKKAEKKKSEQTKGLPKLTAHFIDVGQADASLITYGDRAILIDAGDWNKNEVVGYLNHVGVKKLDLIVGSHEHADHIGQIDKVINEFPVDEVWLTGNTATSQVFERVITAIDQEGIAYDEPRAGDSYDIGDLQIDIVSPNHLSGDLNNDSIVMKLTYGAVAFLYTGDAEREAESGIVRRGESIQADILKVGHHGSDTSTTNDFLNKVNPKVAIISVAKNSQYGHPHQTVLDRLEAKGADIYATSTHGNITVSTDGKTYDVATNQSGTIAAGSTGSSSSSSTSGSSSSSSSSSNTSTNTGDCIDLNTASVEELQDIIHIGPARAEDIIDARPFQSVDDLTRINGIAAGRLADIKAEGKACVK